MGIAKAPNVTESANTSVPTDKANHLHHQMRIFLFEHDSDGLHLMHDEQGRSVRSIIQPSASFAWLVSFIPNPSCDMSHCLIISASSLCARTAGKENHLHKQMCNFLFEDMASIRILTCSVLCFTNKGEHSAASANKTARLLDPLHSCQCPKCRICQWLQHGAILLF